MVVSIGRQAIEIAGTSHPTCGHCCVSRGRPFFGGRGSKKERGHRSFWPYPTSPQTRTGLASQHPAQRTNQKRRSVRGSTNPFHCMERAENKQHPGQELSTYPARTRHKPRRDKNATRDRKPQRFQRPRTDITSVPPSLPGRPGALGARKNPAEPWAPERRRRLPHLRPTPAKKTQTGWPDNRRSQNRRCP
jgi:hypothetical protein